MKAYRITHWNSYHETADSRKYESLKYVAKPNKHDGLGYRRIVKQQNRAELYAAWSLVLEVASKGPKGQRDWLVRDGRPLTALDLELMTGFPEGLFNQAFKFFAAADLGWLQEAEYEECKCLDGSGKSGVSPGTPGASPSRPGDSPRTLGASPSRPGDSPRDPVLSVQSVQSPPAGEKKRGGRLGGVAASRTQWAALQQRIRELKGRGEELEPEERAELREKEAALAQLQDQQARGEFAT